MGFTIVSDASVQALSLWNGSGNNAPPAGWHRGEGTTTWGRAVVSGAGSNTPCPGSSFIWPSDPPASRSDEALFCHIFHLPDGVTSISMQLDYDDTLVEAHINGGPLGYSGQQYTPGSIVGLDVSKFQQGDGNVLTFWVRNNSPPTGANLAGVSYTIYVEATGLAGGGVAPPDAAGSGAGLPVAGSGASPSDVVRLTHRTGPVCWETDGKTFRVLSNDQGVLQTPFPRMGGVPDLLLGRDPSSGLPAWAQLAAPAPAPAAVSTTYGTPDVTYEGTTDAPDPVPTPPNPQRACGAAYNMAGLLCSVYDVCVQVINAGKARILSNFTSVLKRELADQVGSLLVEGEFAQLEIVAGQAAFDIVLALAQAILTGLIALPQIGVPERNEIATDGKFIIVRCCAFQALWLTAGDYFRRSASANGRATKDYWLESLAPQWSFFAGSTVPGVSQTNPPWQLKALTTIIAAVPDAAWERAASVGALAPSTQCTTCTGYPPG